MVLYICYIKVCGHLTITLMCAFLKILPQSTKKLVRSQRDSIQDALQWLLHVLLA